MNLLLNGHFEAKKGGGMKIQFFIFIAFIINIYSSCDTFASVKTDIVYKYDNKGNQIGVNGIVDIEEIDKICDKRIASVKIDDVFYEESSDSISGFRAKLQKNNEISFYFSIDSKALYRSIPNAARRDPQMIVYKGANLIVIYQVCGSGGFFSVRDIFKTDAIDNP